jgi:hypothetical protein
MAQPPYAARITNFLRDANNGLDAPSALGTDAELNALINVVNQVVLRLRGITTSSGTLVNFAQSTSQALAGTQDFTATVSQTAFTTTIVYVAAFNSSNVFVFVNDTKLATSAVTVSNSGGFLRVTIAAQAAGNVVTVAAFESGAGLLSRLQTVSPTEGASLIAINDAGGFFTAVQVEAALQEEATARVALATGIGATADLIRRTGTVPFTAAQSMGGFKLTNVADGVSAQDAVTVNQFNAYTAVWNALQAYYMRLDGTTPMAANLPMGANKITGLAVGTASTDAVNKSQIDVKLSIDGSVAMTGALNMGSQRITAVANPVAETDAINLQTARTITAAFSSRAQFTAAGTTSWVVPAGVTKARVRMWGGGGGGVSLANATTGQGGGGGAYAEATITVTPAESLTVTVGAGGALSSTGGSSQLLRGATSLMLATGGVRGDTTGLGGTYSFDASVTGFGINGGAGSQTYHDNTNIDAQRTAYGGSSPQGGSGGRQAFPGAGSAGEAPGGGGSTGYTLGFAGAAGRVEIEF